LLGEEVRFAAIFFLPAALFATAFLGADFVFFTVFFAAVLIVFLVAAVRRGPVFAVFFAGRFLAAVFFGVADHRFVAAFRTVLPAARLAMVPPEQNYSKAITDLRGRLRFAEDVNRQLLAWRSP
jgi:hypothetical protein